MRNPGDEVIRFHVSPSRVGRLLVGIVVLTGVGYIATKLVQWSFAPGRNFGLYDFFHLGKEANLPTYISAILLLLAAVLLAVIARRERLDQRASVWGWIGLATGFGYLSIDEAAQIHEGILGPLFASYFGRGEGIWHFGWYVPFIPIVLILLAVYVPFLLRLPRKYQLLFMASGALYVGGAIGVEMVQSYISFHGIGGGAMALSLLVEEMAEMLGVVLFIYALLSYLSDYSTDLSFVFSPPREAVVHGTSADDGTIPRDTMPGRSVVSGA